MFPTLTLYPSYPYSVSFLPLLCILLTLSFSVTLTVSFVRRPEFGETDSESEDDELEEVISKRKEESKVPEVTASTSRMKEEEDPIPEEAMKSDRRLQRLMSRVNVDSEDQRRRRRDVRDPEILAVGERDRRHRDPEILAVGEGDRRHGDSSGEEDDSIERRHALVRETKPGSDDEEEILDRSSAEGSEEESEEESEYEEYTDSEEETVPRLKPIFVRKEARVTAKEREIEEKKKEKEREEIAMKEARERREQALKMIQEDKKREEEEKEKDEDEAMRLAINAVITDDEDEETSYELWKVREVKRIKREKEEREAHIKELEEIEKLRNMTEEERQSELERNPKIITNQYEKSKYKFLQKYYHRGAFYLDEENDIFKRDIAQPTLEDHHDKEVLPKVMQVKNFGRSGRTKYTHLVDQDTTARDSPWIEETPQTSKFFSTQAAGMKPIFDRPSKRRKHD